MNHDFMDWRQLLAASILSSQPIETCEHAEASISGG